MEEGWNERPGVVKERWWCVVEGKGAGGHLLSASGGVG